MLKVKKITKKNRYYIGIDQSYTSTGFVVLNERKDIIYADIISSNALDDIFKRAWIISEEIMDRIGYFSPSEIVLEGLAYSMRGNASRDLAGLQFIIVSKIKFILKREVTIVSPTTIKKFATGKGRSTKIDMLAVLPKKIYTYFAQDKKFKKTKGLNDVCDAYFLACYLIDKIKNENSGKS